MAANLFAPSPAQIQKHIHHKSTRLLRSNRQGIKIHSPPPRALTSNSPTNIITLPSARHHQNPRPRSPHPHRNQHPQAQKILGNRARPGEIPPDERDHDVHVRQLFTDLQHHDGIHAIQEPNRRAVVDQ